VRGRVGRDAHQIEDVAREELLVRGVGGNAGIARGAFGACFGSQVGQRHELEAIGGYERGGTQLPAGVWSTFPDFTLTIEAQFAEGEYVIMRVSGRGTHQGAWLGIAPRGTPITVTGINLDRVVDGIMLRLAAGQ
jgi:predicted ester cyclase